MAIRWKFKDFLDAHGLSVYAVAVATKGRLSRNSLYNLAKSVPPKRIELATLDTLIHALSTLSGVDVGVEDLIEYEKDLPPSHS